MKYIKKRILESKYEDLKKEYGSLGQYAEHIGDECQDKERFEQIVNKYLVDYNPQIRIANSVEQLTQWDKMTLISELERECLVTESLSDDIAANEFGGKGSFGSFIKVLTALGIKELTIDNKKCSKDYIILYDYKMINKDDLLRVLNRFQSLGLAKKKVTESDKPTFGAYYAVKYNQKLYIEYGLLIEEDKKEKIGEFVLNSSSLKSLLNLKNAPITQFIESFKSADLSKLIELSRIKKDLEIYSPGYFNKKSESYITIKDYVIQVDVYGLGEWSGPNLGELELDKYKDNFNEWVLTKKWSSEVLTSVKASDFWFHFKIKLK